MERKRDQANSRMVFGSNQLRRDIRSGARLRISSVDLRSALLRACTVKTLCHQKELKKDMPLIQVKLIDEVFTSAQKKEIITRLTDAMVSIEGENMRGVTWVLIEEVRSGEWGIGGNALTAADVRALAAPKSDKRPDVQEISRPA